MKKQENIFKLLIVALIALVLMTFVNCTKSEHENRPTGNKPTKNKPIEKKTSDRWQAIGPGGGEVFSLRQDPGNPSVLYAATPAGLFRSNDAGGSWNLINDQYTSAVAVQPSNSKILYAALGDNGFCRSSDGGKTWIARNGGIKSIRITSLTIDPSRTDVIYVGSDSGLFLSTDGGASWNSAGLGFQDVHIIAIDPKDSSRIYVAATHRSIYVNYVYRSTDDGVSWENLNTPFNTRSIVIDPDKAGRLYATSDSGVFKSTDGGDTWVDIHNNLKSTGFETIALDPNQKGTLYLVGSGEVFKSINGGNTWQVVSKGINAQGFSSFIVSSNSANTLYAGTHSSGVLKSTDGGKDWTPVNYGLNNTKVSALSVGGSGKTAILAGIKEGSILKSTDDGKTWTTYKWGPRGINTLAVDPKNRSLVYASDSSNLYKSSDLGTSWTKLTVGFPDPRGMLSIYLGKAFAIDPVDSNTLYIGSKHGGIILKSTNAGKTWSRLGNIGDCTPNTLAISSNTPNTIYVGAIGGIFKSSDAGASWEPVNKGLASAFVCSLAVDPKKSTTVYAGTLSNGVFKTTDGGNSWLAVNNGLDTDNVQALAVDPENTDMVYAGSYGNGIFKSLDGANSWSAIKSGPAKLTVNALVFDPGSPSSLYVATDGRGVFRYTVSH